jgi:hypothetical protein
MITVLRNNDHKIINSCGRLSDYERKQYEKDYIHSSYYQDGSYVDDASEDEVRVFLQQLSDSVPDIVIDWNKIEQEERESSYKEQLLNLSKRL